MLENLTPQPVDKIIALMEMYRADPRTEKLDLGVGVYKDTSGNTPVMRAVKSAEKQLWEEQQSKSYVGLLGDLSFVDAMRDMILGDTIPAERICGAQTPGGTGAIRQLYELIKKASPDAAVWLSTPTWPNHPAMAKHLGIPTKSYRYFDEVTCEVDFDAMAEDLSGVKPGDVVLLHGCCHNPTGANIDVDQWSVVTDMLLQVKAIPMIDLAYQGFGDGLDEDVRGLRRMASRVPQLLMAASCSKNFGLYRDRVGVALAINEDADQAAMTKGTFASLNRLNFSFPPDHGAKLVSMILSDEGLTAEWKTELEEMRQSMLKLRTDLADELRKATNSDRFDFVANHRGMFSRLGLSEEQVIRLREEFGIYMVGDSRINIAGLPGDRLDWMAKAIASVL